MKKNPINEVTEALSSLRSATQRLQGLRNRLLLDGTLVNEKGQKIVDNLEDDVRETMKLVVPLVKNASGKLDVICQKESMKIIDKLIKKHKRYL